MALRLVANVEGRTLRFPLPPGEYVLGSQASAAIRIPHPSVSRQHAVIQVTERAVTVRDLDSRNGTRIGRQRINIATLEPGGTIQFGAITAVLEQLPDDDLEPALLLDGPAAAREDLRPTPPDQTTWRAGPAETFVMERLPVVLGRLAAGASAVSVAQLLGEAVYSALPCVEVLVLKQVEGREAVVFQASRGAAAESSDAVVTGQGGGFLLRATFPGRPHATAFEALVVGAARILDLAGRPGGVPAQPRPVAGTPPPLPDPPTLVPRLRQLYAAAAKVAQGKVSVVILGESGTGKEVLARYVHAASPDADGPFLALNCASLPRDLLESELFGIEKGVATGVEARPGKFELADGGTLFLDEIADMAPETQAKILRVLQSGEVFRLGSREARTVHVRVIAATNRDVRGMLAEGTFRSDLYHRIAGWVVEVPPLRERRADIPNLAAFFLAREAESRGMRIAGISRAALEALTAFNWPGNVRQLETEMARAVLFLEDGELLDTSRLSEEVRRAGGSKARGSLAEVLARVERDEILAALDHAAGNVEDAAARLGVSRATLYRRMKELGIDPRGA